MRRAVVFAFLAMFLSACAEPLEFADWTIPVPEGARVIEYDDPAIEDRGGRIELVEDLVVGARGEDPNYLFFRPSGVGVDSTGRMYVADMGNTHVQVFAADGEYLRTLGQEGQGPGELQMPIGLAIAGDRVIVSDWGDRQLSIWDLEGAHLGDVPMPGRLESTIFGTDAGSIVGGDEPAARRSIEGDRCCLVLDRGDGDGSLRRPLGAGELHAHARQRWHRHAAHERRTVVCSNAER